MKALVVANDELKEELTAYPVNDNMQLQWIKKPDDFRPHDHIDGCIDLLFENSKERIEWLNQLPASVIVVNSVIATLEEIQENFIRINGWYTFLKRPVIEAAYKNESLKEKAESLFLYFGRKTEWVPDITGFITPRIIASVINEAFITLEEKVSVEEEIDTAMKSGTHYPYGPFEWSQKIGLKNIYSLLDTLSKKQDRYHPSDLLKQKALT